MNNDIELILISKNVADISGLLKSHIFEQSDIATLYSYIIKTKSTSLINSLLEGVRYYKTRSLFNLNLFGSRKVFVKKISQLLNLEYLIINCIKEGTSEQLQEVLFHCKSKIFRDIDRNNFFHEAIYSGDTLKIEALLNNIVTVERGGIHAVQGTRRYFKIHLNNDIMSNFLASVNNVNVLMYLIDNNFEIPFSNIVQRMREINNFSGLMLFKNTQYKITLSSTLLNLNRIIGTPLNELHKVVFTQPYLMTLKFLAEYHGYVFERTKNFGLEIRLCYATLKFLPEYSAQVLALLSTCSLDINCQLAHIFMKEHRYDVYETIIKNAIGDKFYNIVDIIVSHPGSNQALNILLKMCNEKLVFTDMQTERLMTVMSDVCKSADIDNFILLVQMGFDLTRLSPQTLVDIKQELEKINPVVRDNFLNVLENSLKECEKAINDKFSGLRGSAYVPSFKQNSAVPEAPEAEPQEVTLLIDFESKTVINPNSKLVI